LQKKIVNNIIPYIAENGYLLYITCSVFKEENEEMASFIKNNSNLELIKMELLKGYDVKADSMFAALLRKGEG
jgi:16S rRNA (cytosine967-C5)-methyltransferase